MADDLVQKLRDSATWISDNVYLDGRAGYSNLRHAAADEIETLRAQADEMAEALEALIADYDAYASDVDKADESPIVNAARAVLSRYRGEGT